MIDLMPNQTFFIQMGIFLFSMALLNFLVFRPVLKILAKRKELTEDARLEAARLDIETQAMVESYAGKIQEARGAGLKVKEGLTQEGEGKARELLAGARQDMESSLEKNRREILDEAKQAQLALRKYSRDLSKEMAEKLIGRKVSA
jgi:F-type H+-transporting ATPase subunit b